VHWCRRDGASSDANYPIVTVRSTPPPPLSQGCPRASLTAGFVVQYARVRWLDSALRRLYSAWKACNRNHTLPCSYCDFDCDRLRPKYWIFDYVSMIDPTLLISTLSSPPRKLRSKNPKVALNLWQKLRSKIGKVALKLRAIWLIFACKILFWSFGTLANFGNEQQNNVYQYYVGLMKCKSQVSLETKPLFTTMIGYTVSYAVTSLV